MIVGILVFLLLFTIASIVLAFVKGFEPTTLITAVFGFCTAESGFLAMIKKKEEKTEGKNEDVYSKTEE